MSVDRPTFSENWHRVAELKPRLRAAVRNYRQHYRGRMWHVLADPANNQFFRLDEPAFRFIGLLDGKRSVAESWRIVTEDMGDAAPTQGEAIQLLGQLYMSNLLQAELPPDTEQVFARYKKRVNREVGGYLMNFLFIRIPLIDPQPLLRATNHLVGWIFGWVGFAFWILMLGAAFYTMAGHWDELLANAMPQTLLKTENIILLGLCFVGTKAIHELGHGYSCAHFGRISGTGGPVHTIGIMFLVFMPVPYVDASSSWTFRNNWHRAYVAAAGMYVELFVAAIAAIIWVNTSNDSVIHDLAYNVVFIASISTILFNGNPLLRFDGYYILSDSLEIANLAQRSKQYLQYLVKKYVFGVRRARSSAHTVGERFWLTFYGIAAFIYRVFICVGILLYVADIFPLFGAMMAAAAIVTWVLVPLGKFIKYLSINQELDRVRGRATVATAAFIVLLIVGIGIIPWPDRGRAEGVVEPVNIAMIHTATDGFVRRGLESGQMVSPDGEPIVIADNREMQTESVVRLSEKKVAELQRETARQEQPSMLLPLQNRILSLEKTITRLGREIDDLVIRAPFSGVWVSRDVERLNGVFLDRGQRIGLVADANELIVRVTADQTIGPRIDKDNTIVELRVKGRPDIMLHGTIEEVLLAGQKQLPSASLGYVAGGSMRVSMDDQSGTQSADPFFEVRIKLDAESAKQVKIGQRVVARFEMGESPLAIQWWRSILQLIQRRFS